MIKNDVQYRVTKSYVDKFESALRELRARPRTETQMHPVLLKAEEDALLSQLEELQAELAAYEVLRTSKSSVSEVSSFEDLPRALIKARIAAGLSQRDLAGRLGLKEQQIQRYEATEYASASLDRIGQVMHALGVELQGGIRFPDSSISLTALFTRLKGVGLDRDFVLQRLLPAQLVAQLDEAAVGGRNGTESLIAQAAATIGRVFDWPLNSVLGSGPLKVSPAGLQSIRFKMPSRTVERRVDAYTAYVRFLARRVLQATPELRTSRIPSDPQEVRRAVLAAYGEVTFDTVLQYVWDLGIPVLPLTDSGLFHGACLRWDGRNVIVLKQGTRFPARWLIDLLHELSHAAQEPQRNEFAVIEYAEIGTGRQQPDDEKLATFFASDVVLAGKADELARICVAEAGGSVERLKAVVPRVAAREGVAVDALANYMAFRLSLQGTTNWWGAATNLQTVGKDPVYAARSVLLEKVSLENLDEIDRALLIRAVSSSETVNV